MLLDSQGARGDPMDAFDGRQHDPELIDCRECGRQFDLAHQRYYDNLCPKCKSTR